MADFVQTSQTKTAQRSFATPIPDIAVFDGLVQEIVTTNPFGCTAYEVAGVPQPPVARNREAYGVRVMYADGSARTVGTAQARAQTVAGFNAAATALLGNAALTAAMGGTPVRDTENETYSCSIRCHDPNGEVYAVTLSRDRMRVSSYSDDAILARVETWADGKPALA
jgi:hypothetical protein